MTVNRAFFRTAGGAAGEEEDDNKVTEDNVPQSLHRKQDPVSQKKLPVTPPVVLDTNSLGIVESKTPAENVFSALPDEGSKEE